MQSFVCYALIPKIFNQAEKKNFIKQLSLFLKQDYFCLNTILLKHSYTWECLIISDLFSTNLKKIPKCFDY